MGAFSVIWEQFGFRDLIDISIVALILYKFLLIIHGTRAVQMLLGVGLLLVLFWVGISFKLHSLNWVLSHFFNYFILILVIIFQDQLRTALSQVGGGKKLWKIFSDVEDDLEIEEIIEAAGAMGRERIGCLIVIERNNGLGNYIATGTKLNASVHSDILYAIFQSSGPLHDGAVIISENKIKAGGCYLPLSKNIEVDRHLGTRHRAALGISEGTDALVIVVSEETGNIGLCLSGEYHFCENESILRQNLKQVWPTGELRKLPVTSDLSLTESENE